MPRGAAPRWLSVRTLLAVVLGATLGSLLLAQPISLCGGSSAALRMQSVPVAALVEAFVRAPLPPRARAISEATPLFFFHQVRSSSASAAAGVHRQQQQWFPHSRSTAEAAAVQQRQQQASAAQQQHW